jgi:putative redox protein
VTAPGQIEVRHLGEDRFTIEVRKHTISVDQPTEDGGTDTAPTPTELFVASLASCVAHYAHRYLARHGLDSDGLQVTATYEIALRPTRVGQVRVDIVPPSSLPSSRREPFLAVASHCTVHNSLAQPPSVHIDLMSEMLSA